MTLSRNNHAIVLGGSIAGLMATRVLTDHFALVTLVERDRLTDLAENRKGVPQGRHIHTLLTRGYETLLKYFPNMKTALAADGATIGDSSESFRAFRDGAYTPHYHSGLVTTFQSRPLLEAEIRQRLRDIPNTRIVEAADAESIVATADGRRVTGALVRLQGPNATAERIDADLVVDASGRGSQATKWLAALGYASPPESVIKMDLAYTSRIYRRKPEGFGGVDAVLVANTPPLGKRAGGILPIEGDRWLATLAGYLGDHAPTDEHGFLEFARSLPAPDVYNAIKDAEPLGPIAVHRYPFSRRRHFDKMRCLPEGFLVMGDALCSFNPVYGQGMSVAAMEATALDECLASNPGDGLPLRFFRKVSKIIDAPWSLASGADFRFPEVEGQRPHVPALVSAYMQRLSHVALTDVEVSRAFLKVAHLVEPPSSLFHPRVVLRVLLTKSPRIRAQPTRKSVTLGATEARPELP